MAAAIREEFGIDAKLIPSDGGVFDVKVDGALLFSKKEEGRHMRNNEEVLAKIREVSRTK